MHIFDFFRDIFSVFGAFSRIFGFGFRKSCQCKRNDKYEVCMGGLNVIMNGKFLPEKVSQTACLTKVGGSKTKPNGNTLFKKLLLNV